MTNFGKMFSPFSQCIIYQFHINLNINYSKEIFNVTCLTKNSQDITGDQSSRARGEERRDQKRRKKGNPKRDPVQERRLRNTNRGLRSEEANRRRNLTRSLTKKLARSWSRKRKHKKTHHPKKYKVSCELRGVIQSQTGTKAE